MADIFGGIYDFFRDGVDYTFDNVSDFFDSAEKSLSFLGDAKKGFTSASNTYADLEKSTTKRSETQDFSSSAAGGRAGETGFYKSVDPKELEQQWISRLRALGSYGQTVAQSTASKPSSVKAQISEEGQ